MLHSLGEENIVVPVGDRTKSFNGMIKLNAPSAYLWSFMQEDFTEDTLVSALLEKYDITKEVAQEDVKEFIEILSDGDILENN